MKLHRICLICSAYADGRSGQTIVLNGLFEGTPQSIHISLRALGASIDNLTDFSESYSFPESCEWYSLGGPFNAMDGSLLGIATAFNRHSGFIKSIEIWSDSIACKLMHKSVDVVVGCSGSPADLLVAAKVARLINAPFIAYLFDDPVYQWSDEFYHRPSARLLERVWAPMAARVITPNEELARAVHVRNGDLTAAPEIVRNAATIATANNFAELNVRSSGNVRIIAYTGSVYGAQADSLRRLFAALDFECDDWQVHIASHQSLDALHAMGLTDPRMHFHGALTPHQVAALQSQADVLFLPLSFDFSTEVIQTSAPLKVGEYLRSGRPILVHAPQNSWLASFFLSRDCGYVVENANPANIAAALRRFAVDTSLATRLTANQRTVAVEFDPEFTRRKFYSVIQEVVDSVSH